MLLVVFGYCVSCVCYDDGVGGGVCAVVDVVYAGVVVCGRDVCVHGDVGGVGVGVCVRGVVCVGVADPNISSSVIIVKCTMVCVCV